MPRMLRPRYTLVGLLFASAAFASIDSKLDQLHNAGADIKTLSADITLTDEDTGGLGEDARKFAATLIVQRTGDDTEALVSFTTKQVGNKKTSARRDVLLQGRTVVDQDYVAKKQTTRKLDGKVDLFKLGEGPFPLPVGQTKEDVQKQFDVTENGDTLQLIPKPGTQLADKYKRITVTIKTSDRFPTKIETTDKNETTITTVQITNVKINPTLPDKAFTLPAPGAGWNVVK